MKAEKQPCAQCPKCTVEIKIPDTAETECPYCGAKLKVEKGGFGMELKLET